MELGYFLPECNLDVEPTTIPVAMPLTTSRQMLETKGMAVSSAFPVPTLGLCASTVTILSSTES